MNNFIRAIKNLDFNSIEKILKRESSWIEWSEESGKNALHYLCGLAISEHTQKVDISLKILKLL